MGNKGHKSNFSDQVQSKQKSAVSSVVIAFVAGFLFGGFLVWLAIVGFGESAPADISHDAGYETNHEGDDIALNPGKDGDRTPIKEENPVESSVQLVIPNQESGGRVFVQYVSLESPGWVVVHETLSDGALGNALGAQRFDAGQFSGAVSLLRVTEVGTEYAAVLYTDNGDRHFDLDLDLPEVDANQNAVQARFMTL